MALWHKAPKLGEMAFKQNFFRNGNKVTWDSYDSFPICILGEKFRPEGKKVANGTNYSPDVRALFKEKIKRTQFKSLIWCSYRKNFEHDLLYEERA